MLRVLQKEFALCEHVVHLRIVNLTGAGVYIQNKEVLKWNG